MPKVKKIRKNRAGGMSLFANQLLAECAAGAKVVMIIDNGRGLKSSIMEKTSAAKCSGLSVNEYLRICDLADEAYIASKASGEMAINPFQSDTEANDIWATRLLDCPIVYGDAKDDFIVLGRPTQVLRPTSNSNENNGE